MNRDSIIRTLLVESCPTARGELAEKLRRCGCRVTPMECDEEASTSHRTEGYALAVLSVDRMRDHGFWLCRQLRSVSGGTDPFILAVSDEWDAGRLAWLFEAGVDDCLNTAPGESWLATRLATVRQRIALGQLERENVSPRPNPLGATSWLTKALPHGFFRTGVVERRFLQVNQALVDMLGYESEEDLLGVDLSTDVYQVPFNPEAAIAQFGGQVSGVELPWKRKDGTPITVRVSGQVIRGADDLPVQFEGIVEDIAEKKRAETDLRETRDELCAIYDGMADGILVVEGATNRVIRTNPAMCKLMGYSEAELLRMSVRDLCRSAEHGAAGELLLADAERGSRLTVDVPLQRKDGSVVYCDVATNRFECRGGHLCTVCLVREATARRHAEEILAKSEARFRALFEGAALGVVLSDRESRVLQCNATFANMLGYSPEELLGRLVTEITHPDELGEEKQRIRELFDGDRESLRLEKRFLHRGGSTIWCRIALSLLPEPGERRRHVIGVVEDISSRKLTEQALRESERMLRGLAENLPDIITLVAPDWTIQYINREPRDRSVKEIIGQSVFLFMPPEYRRVFVDARRRLVASRQVQTVQIRDNFGWSWTVRMVPFEEDRKDTSVLLICTDITDQQAAAEAVQQEQDALRRMLELFERDRELVAFEIHDGFSQQLTGALLNFEAARQAIFQPAQPVDKNFDLGVQLLRESIAESRRLVRGLRPPVLDEFGIVPAIEHLIEDHHSVGGSPVQCVTFGMTDRLAQPLESALFRIVQETLNNARKYSQSKRIRINLSQKDERVRVEVRDWGVGFNPEEVGPDHFGLRGIRERARLLGGSVEIETEPGVGTRICVELPLVRRVDAVGD
ncbi:MAG: PAS domain S-box protein [Pirellulales bacterium]|nr:PAS domain S-box protein [Pirellulales bacterium]